MDPYVVRKGLLLSRALFDDIEEQAQKMHKAGVLAAEGGRSLRNPRKIQERRQFFFGTFPSDRAILKLYAEWEPSNRGGGARTRPALG